MGYENGWAIRIMAALPYKTHLANFIKITEGYNNSGPSSEENQGKDPVQDSVPPLSEGHELSTLQSIFFSHGSTYA